MNYLAHLYLAQPTADSHFGNLLGDFGGKRHVEHLPNTVKNGLDNHYLVDKFTDSHPLVKHAKQYFSPERKRFAGVAIDVVFDYFLIVHWQHFSKQSLSEFKYTGYQLLNQRIPVMPTRMQHVITSMTKNDWFKEYETIDGIGLALDNIAKRIRFTNTFSGAADDIARNYDELEAVFLAFFPDLIKRVSKSGFEST
ncbi:acyl carrier protein phosphodiesterase [Pseudoalteromonas sp. S3431]|uniref:acyl carrier protein phosphodiesterase n=1 Tax=Pseudoalteromonas sp. S3431 TaxID=579537 RepID=UPI0004A14015|nr:ACP phosphodiesterase [Pseudoalteromonas sp. S3431]KDC55627.1 ACP phosphodiesterase [Pseudoalteromonas sp. S3431]